jgi:nicotinate-nucleotide adenylyltransferase
MGMVVIFGGTFNPIHKGHTEIIESILKLDNIDKLLLIPTKIPPHKNVDCLADESDRINMCNIIASRFDGVEVCDIELKREGKSYSIDTLHSIKELYHNNPIAITIGADMVVTFDEWKDYEEILKIASVITFSRGDTDFSSYVKGVEFLRNLGGNVIQIEEEISTVSSTEIREKLLKGEIPHSLMDKEVALYITEKGIYRN